MRLTSVFAISWVTMCILAAPIFDQRSKASLKALVTKIQNGDKLLQVPDLPALKPYRDYSVNLLDLWKISGAMESAFPARRSSESAGRPVSQEAVRAYAEELFSLLGPKASQDEEPVRIMPLPYLLKVQALAGKREALEWMLKFAESDPEGKKLQWNPKLVQPPGSLWTTYDLDKAMGVKAGSFQGALRYVKNNLTPGTDESALFKDPERLINLMREHEVHGVSETSGPRANWPKLVFTEA